MLSRQVFICKSYSLHLSAACHPEELTTKAIYDWLSSFNHYYEHHSAGCIIAREMSLVSKPLALFLRLITEICHNFQSNKAPSQDVSQFAIFSSLLIFPPGPSWFKLIATQIDVRQATALVSSPVSNFSLSSQVKWLFAPLQISKDWQRQGPLHCGILWRSRTYPYQS